MAKTKSHLLEVAGREVTITNPDKVVLPSTGLHQARPGPLLPRGGRRRAARGRRAADDPQALREGHRPGGVLPETRPGEAPGVDRQVAELQVRVRAPPPRRSSSATPPRWPGWSTSAASTSTRTRCWRRTSTAPTSCASTSTRCPASTGGRSSRWPMVAKEVLEDHGLDGVAEDLRLARLPRLHPDRAAVDLPAGAAGRRVGGPRGGEPRARPGHQPVVEGGAGGRVRRLQPERQGPHGRLRLLGAPDPGRPRVHAADLGRGARLPAGASSR